MADREFLLKIVGDVSNAQKSMDKLSGDVDTFKGKITGAAKVIGGAFAIGAAVEFGKGVVDAASNQEQAIGAVNSVFGEYADTVHKSSESAAKDVGLAQAEYEQLATLTGALLKNAGVPLDEVAKSSENLTKIGADLSAMYGGSVADSMGAINSALKGEMDPLEAFGVSLKASAIDAKAVAMGLVNAEGKATDYGKKMATVALITEQSADAQGTFAREAGTVAGSTQILKAQFTDLQANLGQKLLPVVVKFAEVLTGIVSFVDANQSWLIPTVAAIGAIVLAIKAWQLASAAWIVIQEAATVAQLAFNFAMSANPIGLIVIAIAALVAGVILAYKKVDWFRELVDAFAKGAVDAFMWIVDAVKQVWDSIKFAYDWVKDNWPLLLAIITGPFGLAVYAIIKYWDEIKAGVRGVIESIRGFFAELPAKVGNALSNIWNTISQPFNNAFDDVKRSGETVLSWFINLPTHIGNAFHDLADIISQPFKSAFQAIKNLWNQTVGGFGFSVPGWIPSVGGKSFNIPRMASGGIVNGPTIAMIGEAGREAVIPLDRGGIGLGNVVINVYALTANAEVGRLVFNALREYERSSGRSLSSDASGLVTFAA